MTKKKNRLKIFAACLAGLAVPLSLAGLSVPASSTFASEGDYAPVSIINGGFDSISGTYYEGDPTGWTRHYGTTGAKTMIIDTGSNFSTYASGTYYLRENPENNGDDNKILMINSANASPTSENFKAREISEGYISDEISLAANSYYEFCVSVKTYSFDAANEFASIYISGLENSDGEEIELSSTSIQARDWQREYFYIATGTEKQTITIDLWLGRTQESASFGVAFFDEVTGTQFSESSYYEAIALNSSSHIHQVEKSEFAAATVVDTSGLNFDFEDPKSQDAANRLYAWQRTESSSNADAQIIEMNEKNFENLTGLTYPGIDFSNGNTKSLVMWTKDQGYVTVESQPFEIKALGLYRLTLKVKFADLASGSFYARVSETDKIKEDFAYLASYEPRSATSSAVSENGTNSFNNNYAELSFYIQGHDRYNSQVTLSLLLGTASELAEGGVVVDNIVLEQVAYENFSTSGNLLELYTATDDEESITNGYFTRGQAADSSLTYPVAPEDFEVSHSGKNYQQATGIINIYDQYFEYYKTQGYAWANNLANPTSPNGTTSDVNNILMMYNEAPDWQSVTSSTFDISAGEYYNFTFAFKTLASSTINVRLVDEDGITLLYHKDISSSGAWTTYSAIINAGESSSTVTATIELGSEESLVQGYAFFDNMELLDSDSAAFASAATQVDLSGFMLALDPNGEIGYSITEADAFSGSLTAGSNGTATGGIIKGEGNDSFGYRDHESIDDGSLTKNVLIIQTQDGAAYSLTSKFNLSLTADSYYVLKFRLLTSMPDEFKYVDSEGNEQTSAFGVSVGLDSHELITKLKANDGWTEYEIHFLASEAADANFVFSLVSDRVLDPCYAYLTDISWEASDQATYEGAANSNSFGSTVYQASTAAEDEETETPEEETPSTDDTTTDPNNDYIWLLIPSLIFGVTIILAVVLYFLQKFKWNKGEKKEKGAYDREQSLHQDVLANEAKEIRDAEVSATKSHIAELEAQIAEIEEENKQSAAKAREEGKVTKEVQRKFKAYVQKRTKLQKNIEELNEYLTSIQSPDYLLTIEKRILADRRKTAALHEKNKKAEAKQDKTAKQNKNSEKK